MDDEKLHINFIREIYSAGSELGLSNDDIHSVLTSVISEDDTHLCCSRSKRQNQSYHEKVLTVMWQVTSILSALLKVCLTVTAVAVLCSLMVYVHSPLKNFVMRNIQDMIYPFMTSLRYMTLPILKRQPHLSQWYSEECLVKNDYFDQANIDCRPCEREAAPVFAIDLKNFSEAYYNSGKLVVISDAMQKNVTTKSVFDPINIDEEINLGTLKFYSKTYEISVWLQTKSHPVEGDIHIQWKINRLDSLHAVRKLFPRVYVIPFETEVSFHRYLFIDGPTSEPYSLPLTEFANNVLMQGEGESLITMVPSSHCKSVCQPVDVVLGPSQVLFFNWIYWRPVRKGGNHTSTILMSSFY